ncbi:MAG: hypothetical protein KIS87_01330 [Phycisphaeraceae bacterium]|nr:hypothetical protein [Phycisphaeraceae bacterium]
MHRRQSIVPAVRRAASDGVSACWLAFAAGTCLIVAGCGWMGGSTARDDAAPNTGLGRIATTDDPAAGPAAIPDPEQPRRDDVSRLALDLERLLAESRGTPPDQPAEAGTEPGSDSGMTVVTDATHAPPVEAVAPPPEPIPEPTPAANPAITLAQVYDRLTELLRDRMNGANEPFADALALVAATASSPAAMPVDPASDSGGRLSPDEVRTLRAVRDLLTRLGESTDASDAARVLREVADDLETGMGVRIARAELCRRVDGFGSFQPFPRNDFLAGQTNRAIVYAEIDRFAHRPRAESSDGGAPGDTLAVELSQELLVVHRADGRLAWRRPPERIVETSRNIRRDFFLVSEIELPRTLTVGSYLLKVRIRDEIAGSVDEVSIPLGIVADPALAWEGASR